MQWQDDTIPKDEEGRPMFLGAVQLSNDKGEHLASVCWFYDAGPFYAHAMDAKQPEVLRRIGPCTSLDGAKAACERAIEGALDISNRAGYPRMKGLDDGRAS